jgi:site-specific DNA recombinase
VRREHLELAELGRPAGQVGWGVRSVDEREFIREAARRVLEGDGLMTIAREWNKKGVPGASGGPWTVPTLRRVLSSSPIARLREHGVDPSGKTLGALSPAVRAAAPDRQTWDQVREVLLNPERNINVRKASRHLLTGLIHCGGCGAALFSRPRNNTRRYLCAGRRPDISWGSSPIPSTSS